MKPTQSSGKPPRFGREIHHENHSLIRPNEDGKTGAGKCGVRNHPVEFYVSADGEWIPRFTLTGELTARLVCSEHEPFSRQYAPAWPLHLMREPGSS
jgi:hypothetical protein